MNILLLLVGFSVLAIGGLALLLHRLGYSAKRQFADGAEVETIFTLDFPDEKIDEVALSHDRKAAILSIANESSLGIVRAMGKFALAKKFAAADILRSARSDATLELHFKDYADPVFRITFTEDKEAERWAGVFSASGKAS